MTTRTVARFAVAALAAVTLVGSVTACTKSSPSQNTTDTSVPTKTMTRPPSGGPTGPLSTSPLVEKKAGSCPLISYETARSDAGFRLQTSIGNLTQDGKFVGCRFYPNPFPGEHLPPASQVGIEIVVSTYANHTAANNAFITIAEAGQNYQRADIATGNVGLCYETTLYAKDAGKDWACTFAKASKVVVIRTVVTGTSFNVQQLAKDVYPKV